MKLRDCALFTDENISPLVVDFLRSEGFDVLDVNENGWQTDPDPVQMARAWSDGRAIVTHDVGIGQVAWSGQCSFHGVVTLRPGELAASEAIASLRALLKLDPDRPNPFLIIVRNINGRFVIRIRQRSPHVRP